jgi:dTDP-4-amino-4,6-dideoxygalactose transaminase
MNNIQMVDLKTQYQKIEKEVDTAIKEVILSSSFINGTQVKSFKQDLQNYLNVKHVIPCGNGTDALQIALMALGLKAGDEVITSTFTFIATAEVISLLNLKPVFVDVDPRNFNILPEEIEKVITSKTKAIIPVHLYGQCSPMEKILEIATKHNLFVVEDTAQALGSDYIFSNGSKKKAGTIGTIGTTSFFPSKNLGCYGDGGAIFTDNDKLAEKMAMICNHGSRIKYNHEVVGVNSRLDSIQAAVLGIKLKKLDFYSDSRYKSAKLYSSELKNVNWIETPLEENYSNHVYHQYTIKVLNERRDELREYLKSKKHSFHDLLPKAPSQTKSLYRSR